jgi:hypothetical protein
MRQRVASGAGSSERSVSAVIDAGPFVTVMVIFG